jgi:hypothetical protein
MNSRLETAKLVSMNNWQNENGDEKEATLPVDNHSGLFEIHVKGHLDESWSDWLEGLEVKLLDNGEMVLSGYIRDQAELMGVLNKLYRLNLTLLSVINTNQGKVNRVNIQNNR